ncbi:hypothetical protein L1I42_14665 [Maritalea sp. P4.10X]|uniref:Uncharacterized protein n=1 Tax=Maritalea mediterranea TaxID=2909667 RepID=A0ABS9ED96_9HYPH|nr:hypothetical protein [Maritalea mediterranea]
MTKHLNVYMLILLAQSNTMGTMVNSAWFGPVFTPALLMLNMFGLCLFYYLTTRREPK